MSRPALADAEPFERRPYFRRAEAGAVAFIKTHLPQLAVEEKPPVGFLEQVRGDYQTLAGTHYRR